ncbi:hypothetical protein [Agrobacterium vitis]|uniref:hypothetical protein n=1 Tax=Agrobacterium vitis TaxID=373 RepID=UPI002035CE32|nr:hypothetical protein [Agrobacterium vitis]MCM2452829.1 hypothetical protein [Agrobacterium vitis]
MAEISSSFPFSWQITHNARRRGLDEDALKELRHLTDLHQNIKDYCDRFEAAFLLKEDLSERCLRVRATMIDTYRTISEGSYEAFNSLRSISDDMSLHTRWMEVTFRDSVMQLSQFDDALKEFNIQLKKSTHLPVNLARAPRGWNRTFVEAFPTQKNTRNTVAHEAENYASKARRESNTVSEAFEIGDDVVGEGGNVLVGLMTDDSISYSRDGKILTARLDQAAVDTLKLCLRQIEEYLFALVDVKAD